MFCLHDVTASGERGHRGQTIAGGTHPTLNQYISEHHAETVSEWTLAYTAVERNHSLSNK